MVHRLNSCNTFLESFMRNFHTEVSVAPYLTRSQYVSICSSSSARCAIWFKCACSAPVSSGGRHPNRLSNSFPRTSGSIMLLCWTSQSRGDSCIGPSLSHRSPNRTSNLIDSSKVRTTTRGGSWTVSIRTIVKSKEYSPVKESGLNPALRSFRKSGGVAIASLKMRNHAWLI